MATREISAIHHPLYCCSLPGYTALICGILFASAYSFSTYHGVPLFAFFDALETSEVEIEDGQFLAWSAVGLIWSFLATGFLLGLAAVAIHIRQLEKHRAYLVGRFRREVERDELTDLRIQWIYLLALFFTAIEGLDFIGEYLPDNAGFLLAGGFVPALLLARKKRSEIYLEAACQERLPKWREFSLRAKVGGTIATVLCCGLIVALSALLVWCGLGFKELSALYKSLP